MTLTVNISVPENAGNHEAEVKCSTDGYRNAVVMAPGDQMVVHVHAANEVHITEVPAGTKAERLTTTTKATLPPHQLRVLDEKLDVDTRITKLDEFISRHPTFAGLDASERSRLKRQLDVMHELSSILADRIANF